MRVKLVETRRFDIVLLLLIQVALVLSIPSLRVMPLGDSITIGKLGNQTGGYRRPLLNLLQSNGYNITYVGTKTDEGVLRHDGHEGWSIEKMIDSVQEIFDRVNIEPDVILLSIGGYDVGKLESNIDGFLEKFTKLIDRIAMSKPFVHILASTLTPQSDHNVTMFNQLIKSSVDEQIAAGKRVTLVDMYHAFTVADLVDDVHHTDEGYESMANIWIKKIMEIFGPYGDHLPVELVKVEGAIDRKAVTLTFNKPLRTISKRPRNYSINSLDIYNTTLSSDRRQITIHTTLQTPGKTYNITFKEPNFIRSMNENFKTLNQNITNVRFNVGWRFINLSDWHSAEKYIWNNVYTEREKENDVKLFALLKEQYGGDFLMVPGDTNAGTWHDQSFRRRMEEKLGMQLKTKEAIHWGGYFCYTGMYRTLLAGGYSKLLIAFGDHEGGDNPWFADSPKSKSQPAFRKTFSDHLNLDFDGHHRFNSSIDEVPSRPFGTKYENTSHAYIHRNVLIVTVDVLYQKNPKEEIGDAGTVDGQVTGPHLDWLDKVLQQGRDRTEVNHIFVQGHFPVLFPVRKNKSSGQIMTNNENSEFWQMLKKHEVDIYFCGEVHLNTVTKDDKSDLIQIASRGNQFTNFLAVDVTEDSIDVSLYNEIGNNHIMYNYQYEQNGHLQIRKTNHRKEIDAMGELSLLDRNAPLLHFEFEKIFRLRNRPVIGLGYLPSVKKNSPTITSVMVQGLRCLHSLPNMGQFGQTYDAQVRDISLVDGKHGRGGRFTEKSRAAIIGMGPHSGGQTVSYALWMKTSSNETQVLISYEGWWGRDTVATLRLSNGIPEFVVSETKKIVATVSSPLNNGNWRHISMVVPFVNCNLSDIQIFIDGDQVQTTVYGNDEIIYFPKGGLLALGGFGYGGTKADSDERNGYLGGNRFLGVMDDVYIYSKSLNQREIQILMYHQNINVPSSVPSFIPSTKPSISLFPSGSPSTLPSLNPTNSPTRSALPSSFPTRQPTLLSSSMPSRMSSELPSLSPTVIESIRPSSLPSLSPTKVETSKPSSSPSEQPTPSPTTVNSTNPSLAKSNPPTTFSTTSPSTETSTTLTLSQSSQTISPTFVESNTPSQSKSSKPSTIALVSENMK